MQILNLNTSHPIQPEALRQALLAAVPTWGADESGDYLSCELDESSGKAIVAVQDNVPAATVEKVIEEHYSLALTTDKTVITADGVDQAAIAVLMTDSNFDYTVWQDHQVIASGSGAVVNGVAQVDFSTDEAGVYLIEIKRQAPSYQSGYVEIKAKEA